MKMRVGGWSFVVVGLAVGLAGAQATKPHAVGAEREHHAGSEGGAGSAASGVGVVADEG